MARRIQLNTLICICVHHSHSTTRLPILITPSGYNTRNDKYGEDTNNTHNNNMTYDKEYYKQYYQQHKEERKAYKKQYSLQNKEKIKLYRQQHKEEQKEYYKQYYQQHKEELKQKKKEKQKQKKLYLDIPQKTNTNIHTQKRIYSGRKTQEKYMLFEYPILKQQLDEKIEQLTTLRDQAHNMTKWNEYQQQINSLRVKLKQIENPCFLQKEKIAIQNI